MDVTQMGVYDHLWGLLIGFMLLLLDKLYGPGAPQVMGPGVELCLLVPCSIIF